MKRTTIFLDEPLLRQARQLAQSEGKSFAALVREAVAAYVAGDRAAPGVPRFADAKRGRNDHTGTCLYIADLVYAGIEKVE